MRAGLLATYVGSVLRGIAEITILTEGGSHVVSLADLRAAHEGFFPALMNGSKAA
jgi:hypothetical protein